MGWVRQVQVHNNDVFRLRVWHKEKFIRGWRAELKIGSRQWNRYPSKRSRERQTAELQARHQRLVK